MRAGDDCTLPADAEATNTIVAGPTDPLGQQLTEPPALPPPGASPSDPTDATAEVLAAIRTMYDMADPLDESKTAVAEDPELSSDILAALRANRALDPFLSKLDPVFGSVVFTDPTNASVLYRVGPAYQWEIGRVVLIDDAWRVASGTVCRDLADANYVCPGVTPDPPPGPLGGTRIPVGAGG